MYKFKFVFVSWKSSCCFLAAASPGHGWSHTGLGFFRSRTDHEDDCEEKRGDVIAQSWTQGVRAECLSELLLVLISTWSSYPHRQRLAASHGQCQIMASVKPKKAREVAADDCPWCVIVDRREPGSHEREALDVDSDPPNRDRSSCAHVFRGPAVAIPGEAQRTWRFMQGTIILEAEVCAGDVDRRNSHWTKQRAATLQQKSPWVWCNKTYGSGGVLENDLRIRINTKS